MSYSPSRVNTSDAEGCDFALIQECDTIEEIRDLLGWGHPEVAVIEIDAEEHLHRSLGDELYPQEEPEDDMADATIDDRAMTVRNLCATREGDRDVKSEMLSLFAARMASRRVHAGSYRMLQDLWQDFLLTQTRR